MKLLITIDGPAAGGKGTAADLLAKKYRLLNIDSGAMYRAAAWLAVEHHVPIDENHEPQILELVEQYPIKLVTNHQTAGPSILVKVGHTDITTQIRAESISRVVSTVGQMLNLREKMKAMQRQLAEDSPHGAIAEGRDTGTVVFPDANIKFFLTATPEVRAERRLRQLVARGEVTTFEQVYADLQERDRRDTERAYSALRIPADAVMIDSTSMEIEDVIALMSQAIEGVRRKGEG